MLWYLKLAHSRYAIQQVLRKSWETVSWYLSMLLNQGWERLHPGSPG